jgi:hypothetical protein
VPRDEFERLGAVGRRRHRVTVERERADNEAAQPFFVFGDDNPRHFS